MSKCCCSDEISCCETETSCCAEDTTEDKVHTVSTRLAGKDILGAWKVRWGIGRMNYKVEPGLYKVIGADSNSPVLVSANYKLTFDTLRKNLEGLNCWLLILDTKGVNVWCAAGEGTFGTEELVNRIEQTGLAELINHRKLILPQLGASGVNAHEITMRTGFSVIFGPIRAGDIKNFISAGMKATKKMRMVRFTFWDRLVLTPMEITETFKFVLPVLGAMFIFNLFVNRQFGIYDTLLCLGAILSGAFVTPVLLPFIPGRAFAFKGWLVGLLWAGCTFWLYGWYAPGYWLLVAGYGLLLPAVSSFLAMNFTGASTYTSPSGVLKEMKIALPFIIGLAFVGAVLVLIKSFWG